MKKEGFLFPTFSVWLLVCVLMLLSIADLIILIVALLQKLLWAILPAVLLALFLILGFYSRSLFCRYRIDETGIALYNRLNSKATRFLRWKDVLRLTVTSDIFAGTKYTQKYYIFSSSAVLDGFQGIEYYLKIPKTVVLPKNEEITRCVLFYKERFLDTRADFRDASQNACKQCEGEVYPSFCRTSFKLLILFGIPLFLVLSLIFLFIKAWILSSLFVLFLLGSCLSICIGKKYRTRYLLNADGIFLINPHKKKRNHKIAWHSLVQVQEVCILFYDQRSVYQFDYYLLSEQPFHADWEKLSPYFRRNIVCVPKSEEVRNCIEQYSRCKIEKA